MDFSDSLRVFLAALIPIGELRLAIPLGIYTLDMRWYQVLPLALVGNMIPPIFLVPGLERVANLLQLYPNPIGRTLNRFLFWRAEGLRTSQGERFQKYGPIALILLVAIPLPLTGAWTGSLASWVFQVPPRQAIPLIAVGVLIAGVVVTLLTVGGIEVGVFLAESND